jgi:hypothetical protein
VCRCNQPIDAQVSIDDKLVEFSPPVAASTVVQCSKGTTSLSCWNGHLPTPARTKTSCAIAEKFSTFRRVTEYNTNLSIFIDFRLIGRLCKYTSRDHFADGYFALGGTRYRKLRHRDTGLFADATIFRRNISRTANVSPTVLVIHSYCCCFVIRIGKWSYWHFTPCSIAVLNTMWSLRNQTRTKPESIIELMSVYILARGPRIPDTKSNRLVYQHACAMTHRWFINVFWWIRSSIQSKVCGVRSVSPAKCPVPRTIYKKCAVSVTLPTSPSFLPLAHKLHRHAEWPILAHNFCCLIRRGYV